MKKLMLGLAFMMILSIGMVSAYASFRSDTGHLVYANGYDSFDFTKIHTSLYESRGVIRGGIQITADTSSGERVVKNVKIRDVRMTGVHGNYLLFRGYGYYYERYKDWDGRYKQRKVEGVIHATHNVVNGKTTLRGDGDLNFRVYRIYLNQL